ncbi:hypothetical protein [Streptomyces sp. NPDC058657]|uniref:hypothetical protein n=1 Tax=unclassified Streptomyces TaxID=2593676 RepID=UPI00366583CC
MAPKTELSLSLRAVRQLRRTRIFYAAGALLWAVIALWTGWTHPGSRQMWVSLLLSMVFAVLLGTASLWLHRLLAALPRKPVRRAATRRAITAGHVNA